MKKKIFTALLLLLPALLMTSCLKDQEDIFEEPAALRLNDFQKKAQQTLMSSEYGWVFDVYPEEEQSYGGWAFTCKFDSLTVDVGCELDTTQFVTSYYKITSESSAALIFDTYNAFMHYFSEGTQQNYQGFNGDTEFVIDSISDNLIKVHGARTRNTMYLRKLDKPAKEYLKEEGDLAGYMIYSVFNGTSVNASVDLDNRQITFEGTDSTAEEQTTAFVCTDNGLRFYNPVTIGGQSVSEVALDGQNGVITLPGGEKLTGVLPEGYRRFEDYDEGSYTLTFDDIQRNVTLTADKDNSCFYMTGLFPNQPDTPVTLTWSKSDGALHLNAQPVGTEGGNTVWLAAWALQTGGNLTWNTAAGMVTQWNGNAEHPSYTLVNNGQSNYAVDSFIMWTTTAGGSNVGQYTGTNFHIYSYISSRTGQRAYSGQMPYVTTLVKN